MDTVEAYISLISTVLEQPTDIVRGWLNTYYVLRRIAERPDDQIISETEECDHAADMQ